MPPKKRTGESAEFAIKRLKVCDTELDSPLLDIYILIELLEVGEQRPTWSINLEETRDGNFGGSSSLTAALIVGSLTDRSSDSPSTRPNSTTPLPEGRRRFNRIL